MTRHIDLTGQTFARLSVVGRAPNSPGRRAMWTCECVCGGSAVIASYGLRSGRTRSCGCLQAETRHLGVITPLEERLRQNSDRTGDCWLWTGVLNHSGYAEVDQRGRYLGMAHRISYEMHVGPIPDGLTLDHLCRVRHCINPAHLEPVTRGENSLRGVGWAGQHARQEACKRGHPFDEQNTYRWRTGRICRECRRLYNLAARRAGGTA